MLVAIEGIDGSGKGTQTALLGKRLEEAKIPSVLYSFPRYTHNPFGKLVGRYLNGDFGPTVSPTLAAMLYAGDRYTVMAEMRAYLDRGRVVVCDRYVDSNLAHQTARTATSTAHHDLLALIREVEYGIYNMPVPDLVVFLDMPLGAAEKNVQAKMARKYTDKKADLHEADAQHLETTYKIYRDLMIGHGTRAVTIECRDGDTLIRKPESIAEDIWRYVIDNRFGVKR